MVRNATYQNPIHQEENTPLVTILETRIDTKQSVATDTRGAQYVIDLAKASFGGISYPQPGTQWYVKKISGTWALMARAPRQNPQLDPAISPKPGESYIGDGGKTVFVGDVQVNGGLAVGPKVLGVGYIGANTYTANPTGGASSSTSAEAAVASATWATEPTYALLSNHLYRVEVVGCLTISAGTVATYSTLRLRKGAETIVGTELWRWEVGRQWPGFGEGFSFIGWIKNTSASTVNSKLSLTIMWNSGASTTISLGGDVNRPLVLAVHDVGLVADNTAIANIARSV